MSQAAALPRRRLRVFMETQRKDAWWAPQLATLVVISVALVYIHWALFQGEHYDFGPYLSPLYSPVIWGDSHHAILGPAPSWFPSWYSPAMIILVFPAGFRFTCYYYRGAYYKAFWADPPGCAVGEPRGKGYLGERSFPLVFQNVHRYFMYAAVAYIFILSWDAIRGFVFEDGFGIGIGSLVLLANTAMLAAYTFSCHSFRHMIGGGRDSLPKSTVGRACYEGCTSLNRRHMLFAWVSLFTVTSTDIYIRLCSMGVIDDLRIL